MDYANNEIFNVGTGIPIEVNTVVEELINNFKIEVPVKISGNYRLGDIRHNFADLSKINDKLKFAPKVQFKEGIKLFVDWVNTQQVQNNSYEDSITEMKLKGLLK